MSVAFAFPGSDAIRLHLESRDSPPLAQGPIMPATGRYLTRRPVAEGMLVVAWRVRRIG